MPSKKAKTCSPETADTKAREMAARVARMKNLTNCGKGFPKAKHDAEMDALMREGVDVLDLIGKVNVRHYDVLMLHLAGFNNRQIMDRMGFAIPGTIREILRRREIAYLKRAIQKEQKDAQVRGEFGVNAAMIAAAPQVAANVIEKAGAGPRGKKAAAEKESDQLRAAAMILKHPAVAAQAHGAPGELSAILRNLTPEELEGVKKRVWPERYRPVLRQLGFLPDAEKTEAT